MNGDNPRLLLQDCDSKLSKWFASRPDARYVIRRNFMPTEITITAYKYNELEDRAKEKARGWYCENAMHHEWWDCVYEHAKHDGEALGFDIDDIRFSGFWSQGDGAHWTGRIDLVHFLRVNLEPDSAWYGEDVILLELWENGWIDRFVVVENRNYRYNHSGGMYISDAPKIEMEYMSDDDDAVLVDGVMQGANVMDLYNSFDLPTRVTEWCDEAIQKAREYADDIYKKLEKEYDHYTSDECIADTCDANEWLFDESGKLIN